MEIQIMQKAKEAIIALEKTDMVIINNMNYDVNLERVVVMAYVSDPNKGLQQFDMHWVDDEQRFKIDNKFSNQLSFVKFHYKSNLFKLECMPQAQLISLLEKANSRRKAVERNMRKYAQRYYKKVHEHYDTLQRWKAERQQWKEREWEIQRKENEYKQWRDNVDELVSRETAQHNALFALQECSHCEEKQWRKKYRQTYSGMSEFCGKYINIVDDMMRQKDLPDNVKARLCDMRVAFVESREFLDKVMKEESNNKE